MILIHYMYEREREREREREDLINMDFILNITSIGVNGQNILQSISQPFMIIMMSLINVYP